MVPAQRVFPPIKTVGLASASHRRGMREFIQPLLSRLQAAGVTVLADAATAEVGVPECRRCERVELFAQADIVFVMGGDGTLLSVARQAASAGVPLLGVDLGSFGFLAAEQPATVLASLDELLAGHYHIQERLMLAVEIHRQDQVRASFIGLNDVVIAKISPRRMVRLDTHVDGERVAIYPADGLIISTPTGSTAYSLSAGGPLVDPALDCLVLNPICPHTLYLRPLIVAASAVVTVALEDHESRPDEVSVSVDGQEEIQISPDDVVVIKQAPFKAQLVTVGQGSFFARLHSKLRWGLER